MKDVDGSSIVSSATIQIFNKNQSTNTTGKYNSTTGAYIVDLANAGEYSNGDTITLDISSGNKRIQYRTTVNTTDGNEEVSDLTLIFYDVLGMVVDMLTDGWDESTTDNIDPSIQKIVDRKAVSGFEFSTGDFILCYELNETIAPFGLGASKWEHKPPVTIDVRTTFKKAAMTEVRGHLIKMQEEIFRILKSKVGGYANFGRIMPVRKRDLSDKSVGRGRMIIDVEPTKWV